MPYQELVRKQVLAPLGLSDTTFSPNEDQQRRLAAGHDEAGKPAGRRTQDLCAPAGALLSTAGDMLKFLQAYVELSTQMEDAAGPPLRKAMRLTLIPSAPYLKGGAHVCLAWILSPSGKKYWHNGRTGGYSSYCSFAEGRAIVVLSNRSTPVTDILGIRVQTLVSGSQPEAEALKPLVTPRVRRTLFLSGLLAKLVRLLQVRPLQGYFRLPFGLRLSITMGITLWVWIAPKAVAWWRHAHLRH